MSEPKYGGPFVITGLSGSGKTVLSRSLEDAGFRCVDNIPLELLQPLFATTRDEAARLAVVLDVRARGMAEEFPTIFQELKREYPELRLIFVEAETDVLLRRYSVVRRPHPMKKDGAIEDAIASERTILETVRGLADLIVDTTNLSPHDLRRQMYSVGLGENNPPEVLAVEVESFSYLQGTPSTASLVFDVRFLPNPYFEEELRHLAGDDEAVRSWLDSKVEVDEAVDRFVDLALFLLPKYGDELKSHLTIAIGCTGGRHRSVYVTNRMAEAIREAGRDVVVRHRDKERWRSV